MPTNLEIVQGSTFERTVRWETPPFVYKAITAITRAAPAVITAPAHGLPERWRVAVVSAGGMDEINANDPPKAKQYKRATVVDGDTISLNEVNSTEYSAYTSGGYLQYYTPVDLSGYTARMKIKDRVGGTTLVELTTENGGISLDNTAKKIVLTISADDTDEYTWTRGVYDLELVSPTDVVTKLLTGKIKVVPEVTT